MYIVIVHLCGSDNLPLLCCDRRDRLSQLLADVFIGVWEEGETTFCDSRLAANASAVIVGNLGSANT